MNAIKNRMSLLLSAVLIAAGIVACDKGTPPAASAPAAIPTALAAAAAPIPTPTPAPTDATPPALLIPAPVAPVAQTQTALPTAVLDDVRQAHEQSAKLALASIQALISTQDFTSAQQLATTASKDYADTSSALAFAPLLQQAQAGATAATQARAGADAHAKFVAARDAGVAAMNQQNYPQALAQFQQALGFEDDPATRAMLQSASNFAGKPRIAIADFDVIGDVGIRDAGKAIPELMLGRFDTNRFQLVDRAWLDSVLAQQGLTLSQIAQMPEILRVRKVDAMRYLVEGSVTRLGALTISARLVDVSTGEIVQTADVSMSDPSMMQHALTDLTAILQMNNEQKATYLAYRQRQSDALAASDPATQAAAQAQYVQAMEAQRQQMAAEQAAAFAAAQHERDAQAALADIKVLLSQADYAHAIDAIHWALPRFRDTSAAQELSAMEGFATAKYQDQVAQQANATAWAQAQADMRARHQRFEQDRDQGMTALAAGDLLNAMTLLQNALGEEDNPNVRGVLDYIASRMQRPGIVVADFSINGDVGISPREAPRWLAWLLSQQFGGQDSPYRLVGRDEFAMDLSRVGLTMADVQRDPLNPRMRLLRDQIRFVIVGVASHGSVRLQTTMVDLEVGRPAQSADFIAADLRALPNALASTAQVLQMDDAQKHAYLDQLAYTSWMSQGDAAAAALNWDVAYDAYVHACQVSNTPEAQDRLANAGRSLQEFRAARHAYDDVMTAAVAAGRANDWGRALDLYRQAWSILPTDDARRGIESSRDKVIAAARDRHALYLASMSAADGYARANDWDRALDAYQDAWAAEQTPEARDAMSQVQRAIADRQAAKDRAYAQAMDNARKQLEGGYFQVALNGFTNAAAIKNTVEATNGMTVARKRLAEHDEVRGRYDGFMADAVKARQAGDWQKALDNYRLAASVLDTPEVQKDLTTARNTLAQQQKNNQKQLYDAAMANARTHVAASQWQDALVDYRNAYQVDKTKEAAAGVAQASKMINDAAYSKKQYDTAMAAGDAAAASGNWNKALASYQQAEGIDPTAQAKAGVQKAGQQIAAAAGAEKQKQYADLMNQGAAAVRAGELNKALGIYTKAGALNNTAEAQAAVADIQKKMADAAATGEKKKQYDAQITVAEAAAKAGQWPRALDAYTRAAAIDNTAQAQAGIANARGKIDASAASANAAADKKKEYESLMAEGATAGRAGDWQKALDAYTKASAIDNTAESRTAMANARQQIAAASAAAANADKKKQYDTLMAQGAAADKTSDWNKAIDAYTKAQAVDNTAEVRTALANARKELAAAGDAATAAAKKKQIDQLMADAAAAGKAGDWQKALDTYTKAQAMDNTPEVRTQIANARRELNAAAANDQKKKQAAQFISDGDAAAKAGQWQKAADAYTKAQAIENTPEAQAGLANAKAKLADAAAAAGATAEKTKQYDAAMNEGEVAGRGGDWQKAVDAYTKAAGINNTPAAQTSLNNAKKKLADTAAAASAADAKKKQYAQFMADGNAAGTAGDWNKALDDFTKAQALDNTAEVKTEIANARKKIAEGQAAGREAADKKKQYEAQMNAGETAAKANQWQKSLDAYTKAAALDNTPEAQAGVATAKQKLADAADAAAGKAASAADKKKEHDQAVAEGDAAAKASDWQTAYDSYSKAQELEKQPAVATKLANAKQKVYAKLMADGEAAGKANQWSKAVDDYTKAQAVDNTPAVKTALENAKKKAAP